MLKMGGVNAPRPKSLHLQPFAPKTLEKGEKTDENRTKLTHKNTLKTMKNSKILLLSLLFACVGTAKADLYSDGNLDGTEKITDLAVVTNENSRNIYIISSQDGNPTYSEKTHITNN